MSREIAGRVAERGGRAYYVGGFVRDMLMSTRNESPDIDIEVHGLRPEELKVLLSELGEVISMGVSFGVLNLRHYNIDIAMPRMEHATGRGHKDFEVFVDPFIGAENAARRRDFTINALMQDVLTGEILDFFGGQDDLRKGILRHVDDVSFAEDPLRVFRLAQFAARFGFSADPGTMKLCSGMDVSTLSKERVFGETEKALLKSADPARYFTLLSEMGQLSLWFPEVSAALERGCGERLSGVLSKAAGEVNVSDRSGFMCAAVSVSISRASRPGCRWLRRICNNKGLIRYCDNTSAASVKLLRQPRTKNQDAKVMRLLEIYDSALEPEDALALSEILSVFAESGSGGGSALMQENKAALKLYNERVGKPAVTGRDLIQAGVKPGPEIGKAVKFGEKLRLSGVEKEEAMKQVLKALKEGE